ncbi:OmpA family protein [Ectothiorhodospira marina]|uniref:Outer membrane protein OmpA n=1 Tax=Ectothiorhodospira marina TaxID=1396821 RepID=A0A1H7Q5J6_9GAMM|nr:OmpA family protein [Ectothiorhodospira marina]SEL43089.1 Outer membrane protein OmpA [Ectothiorhodospira marina]
MRHPLLIIAVAALVALAGCTTIDPYTREDKVSASTKGAAIGAVAGALVGNLTTRRDRTKRAMVGAGIGALAGAAVGNYMDRQEQELRRELDGTGVSVTRVGDNVVLNMPGNVTFDVNRDEVKSRFYDVLNSVAKVAQEFDQTALEVAGHTDSTGSVEYNMDLSERRARSVARYLQSQGVSPVRLDTIGFGPHRPVADNHTPQGRAQNRRVELTFIPLTQ